MTGYDRTARPTKAGIAIKVDRRMHSLILSVASCRSLLAIAVATAGISAVDVAELSATGILTIGLKR